MDAILKYFDTYNRIARIYPACLALAPAVWTSVALLPGLFSDVLNGAIFTLVSCAAAYLFASLARSLGKNVEDRLLKVWGGWPTTILLRHRNGTIDPSTKARYHAALSKICPDVVLPSPDEESRASDGADAAYRSATKRLIEARREPTHHILHFENASYGFRRNMLALKPFGLAIALFAASISVAAWWLRWGPPINWADLLELVRLHPALFGITFLNLACAAIWLKFVQPPFVYQAGCEYAHALFKTLDLTQNSSTE